MHSFHSKRGCNYYWIADIDDMLRRLSALHANIVKGLPNARQNLETFKAERKQLVKNIKDVNTTRPLHCITRANPTYAY